MEKKIKLGIYNFIKEINSELDVKFQDFDLQCDIFDEIIYIGKAYDKRIDELFENFINKLDNRISNINPFLIEILHEIGHIETWDSDNADIQDLEFALLKEEYSLKDENDYENLKKYCELYFKLPLEINATLWGINYALNHLDLMEKYNWLSN